MTISSSHVIVELSVIRAKFFLFLQLHVEGFQYNISHIHDAYYTHINIYHYSTIDQLHFLSSNLHLHLHDISFVKIFGSFIPVIILLKTLIFKSSVLFGAHTLLDKSLRVLKLPIYLSNLTASG